MLSISCLLLVCRRIECPRFAESWAKLAGIRTRGVEMIDIYKNLKRGQRATYVFLTSVCLLLALTLSAQAPNTGSKSGIVRQLSEVRFPAGEGPDCLQFFLENGDMKTGPSTAIMKAKPKCVVPPHYHTAEEQLIIVKGDVSTGMEGMKDAVLGPGGFAMMPSKAPHWFTCTAKEECLMFVTFDRAYDIVWIKPQK